MILNLACGDRVMDMAVNVDVRPTGTVVADVRDLPFRADVFGLVYAFDVLEHFTREGFLRVMGELRRVCLPGATLVARVPNLRELAARIVQCPGSPELLIRNIYGGHRWGPDGAWDAHHHGWTPTTFDTDLAASGWRVTANDEDLNMTVEATLEGAAA